MNILGYDLDCLSQEQSKFLEVISRVTVGSETDAGIGVLGEKSLHATIKYYLEPDSAFHEVKIGKYYADIAKNGEIVEIQTRSFDKLRSKLNYFLSEGFVVRIVYPIPAVKWMCWIDPENGNISSRRKSPRRGSVWNVIPELYKIKPLLPHPNLDIVILLLEVQEYRNLDGWSHDRKKGSTRYERVPVSMCDILFTGACDSYRTLIPENLPYNFTSLDFSKNANISKSRASTLLTILSQAQAVERVGKIGNSYVYNIKGN